MARRATGSAVRNACAHTSRAPGPFPLKSLPCPPTADECRERSRSPSPEPQWRRGQRVHALPPSVPVGARLAPGPLAFNSLQAFLAGLDLATANAELRHLLLGWGWVLLCEQA